MRHKDSGSKTSSEQSLYKRSDIVLLEEKQWLFLQKRYHMTDREL